MICEKHGREMYQHRDKWRCGHCIIEESEAMLLVPPVACEKHGVMKSKPRRIGGLYIESDCHLCRDERVAARGAPA